MQQQQQQTGRWEGIAVTLVIDDDMAMVAFELWDGSRMQQTGPWRESLVASDRWIAGCLAWSDMNGAGPGGPQSEASIALNSKCNFERCVERF